MNEKTQQNSAVFCEEYRTFQSTHIHINCGVVKIVSWGFFCCIRLRVFDRTKSRNHFQLRLLLKGKGAQILVWVMNLKMRNNCFVILSCPTKAKFIASLIWHTHIRYTEKLNLVNLTYPTTRDLAQFSHTPTFWDGSIMQNLELVISYHGCVSWFQVNLAFSDSFKLQQWVA